MTAISDTIRESITSLANERRAALRVDDDASAQSLFDAALGAGLPDEEVYGAVAKQLNVPFIDDLPDRVPAAVFFQQVPIGFARRFGVIGVKSTALPNDDDTDEAPIIIVAADLAGLMRFDAIKRLLDRPAQMALAPRKAIESALNRGYESQSGQTKAFLADLDEQQVLTDVQKLAQKEDLLDVSSRAPVIKLVNLILFEAFKQQASDIHLQPYEGSFIARMRIDGVLHDCFTLPKNVQDAVISRVKVMGKMNIAEKRLPQDGRTTVNVGDREIDLRIASLPSNHGERVVIRLLDKSARLYTLGEIGMNQQTMNRFRQLVSVEHGIMLVTGPTGSGKTTTLYGTLDEINDNRRNIITLEDPIEYQLPGVSQTQINEKKGLTFASGLRSVLRQDPDIIMVGEIRDHETAVMAIQSALTGHLVFSTLHTNDAASAVTRLLDLGIEPYLVASSVAGVLAQRLVRQVCPKCVQASAASQVELDALAHAHIEVPADLMLQRAIGCEDCRHTGYRGRLGIFELLTVNDDIRADIQERTSAAQIKQTAIKHSMQTLRDDGIEKVIAGRTTLEEVDRVTIRAEVSAKNEIMEDLP